VPVKYMGEEFKTGFNVRFFTEALANLDGEDIKVQVGEKLLPALLTSESNPGYQIVIMPMRI
jgi:DNA polymerase III sliding clamp (beta) subunit (PCNA family)